MPAQDLQQNHTGRRHEQPAAQPRIIIHGGAGNITKQNLSDKSWKQYEASLKRIVRDANKMLQNDKQSNALDVAVYAVQQLERDPRFNAGHGAVFTRAGKIELEASVMVSRRMKKRGVAVSMLRHVKSPISLAAEMLERGEDENGGGAQAHLHLSGDTAEQLAQSWGLDIVPESYFWTKKRWQEHKRGLENEKDRGRDHDSVASVRRHLHLTHTRPDGTPWPVGEPTWDGREYLPQGTVGAVVLDKAGMIAVATSTGGLTNKLPGRIGDTPTIGAGFWAEEWAHLNSVSPPPPPLSSSPCPCTFNNCFPSTLEKLGLSFIKNCFGSQKRRRRQQRQAAVSPLLYTTASQEKMLLSTRGNNNYCYLDSDSDSNDDSHRQRGCGHKEPGASFGTGKEAVIACGLSGTGNGDSFLKLDAARTVAARARFTRGPEASLRQCVEWMVGRGGEMQRSAGSRWGLTGEGEGGFIGIKFFGGTCSEIVYDFNCGGMFRAYIDSDGNEKAAVFREAQD